MLDETLVTSLAQFVREIAELPEDKPIVADSFLADDLGVDSLMLVDLVVRAEREFRVIIDEEKVQKIRTFGDFCACVEELRSAATT